MRRVLLLGLLVLASGCVHIRHSPLDTDAGRADLNARAAGHAATLHVRGAPGRSVRNLHLGPDETTWIDRISGQPESAPTSDVSSVSMHRGGSVWRSTLIGAGVGAVAGVLSAASCEGFFCYTPLGEIGLFGLGGAAVGAGVGASQSERFVPPRRAGVRPDTLR